MRGPKWDCEVERALLPLATKIIEFNSFLSNRQSAFIQRPLAPKRAGREAVAATWPMEYSLRPLRRAGCLVSRALEVEIIYALNSTAHERALLDNFGGIFEVPSSKSFSQ